MGGEGVLGWGGDLQSYHTSSVVSSSLMCVLEGVDM